MMMQYKIVFFDYWHISSGVSAGPALDSTVVKTKENLPYVPGKTLKGLLSEMVALLDESKIETIFGAGGAKMGEAFFSNATLDLQTSAHLKKNPQLVKHLYDKISATKIDDNGIALDKSLREIEVTVPLTLTGTIECQEEDKALLVQAMGMVKQMGLNRNRGLGRCQITEVENDG
jgi:CRISPR/Cas system CSM-associated protein Csm3 (group 7 of RAMP superfamily)